ncbi:hypothetical protein [Alkalibacterium pelagium]|uniref:Uncharacterized protein n=1 Tax=Alkalibacterium pelagium TaxID=426702 RepID=A0A1H7I3E3_9LACT|nr:hypothetical protein [Alkalibacterium pelagium]GEN49957.1 hypothetical protein APE02nite_06220 [Alkalibacterium pelagium]SEK57049.1 hypothetical protein SAMN04488099_1042 [Alkalibacterium pelagium]
MISKVELIIEYDNLLELSQNAEYKKLGEEILVEKNISTEYQDFKKLVTELKRTMVASGAHRNSIDIVYNEGFLTVIYKVLNMPKSFSIEEAEMIKKVQVSFEEYLKDFEEVNITNNFRRLTQIDNSQMIRIGSQGSNLSFEETEKIFNYLNEKEISYEIYQGESSSVEAGAGGGFSNILILISGAADVVTILTAIKGLIGGEESAIVGQEIDNMLEKKAKEIISKRFDVHFNQVFFVEQNNKNSNKQFIFKTRIHNQFYEVIYDENNKLERVGPTEKKC